MYYLINYVQLFNTNWAPKRPNLNRVKEKYFLSTKEYIPVKNHQKLLAVILLPATETLFNNSKKIKLSSF